MCRGSVPINAFFIDQFSALKYVRKMTEYYLCEILSLLQLASADYGTCDDAT